MIGDVSDFVWRINSLLPRGWFADTSPVMSSVLQGFGAAWASVYGLIESVIGLTRISTSTGYFLDLASVDFFGDKLIRRQGESDLAFTLRIKQELLRPRGTRAALERALQDLTGRPAMVVEPARPIDTGGYAVGGLAYGKAGAWGNLSLPHSFFVTAFRPHGSGIAQIAGYGTGGPVVYGNVAMMATAVSDTDIYAAAAAVLPVAATAWLRIEN